MEKWAVSAETQNSYLGGINYAQSAIRSLSWRRGGIGRRRRVCQRRTQQDGAEPEGLGDASGRLRQYALFEAEPDQRIQRRQTSGRLDLLDRRPARPWRRPARYRQHHVRPYAVPK